jgi:hypothetical protein
MPMTFQANGQDFREQLADGSTGLDWRGWATVGRDRPIKLEIAEKLASDFRNVIVARVYLRAPRCFPRHHSGASAPPCECGPLAEKMVG